MANPNSNVPDQNLSNYNGDPLFLHNSDHPGMQLVSTPLNGNNFLSWSRSVKIALAAKVKLGFITGNVAKPDDTSPLMDQWSRCDSMVICWILNAMVSSLAEGFLYSGSAKELWDEICERFGQSNGPLLYQLNKDISDTSQGNESIAGYYTKLKRFWDELNCLSENPKCTCGKCTCGVNKKIFDHEHKQRTIKFLMGMNDGFDNARGQILLLDPLPSINKTYSMVQQVEKQKQVISSLIPATDMAAYHVNKAHGNNSTYVERKDQEKPKNNRFCNYCRKSGHTEDFCWKKHGRPQGNKNPRSNESGYSRGYKSGANYVTHDMEAMETPLDIDTPRDNDDKGAIVAAVMEEVRKLMKGHYANDSAIVNYAGPYN